MTALEWVSIVAVVLTCLAFVVGFMLAARARSRVRAKAAELARRAEEEHARIRELTAELDDRARATAVPTTAIPVVHRTHPLTGQPVRKVPHGRTSGTAQRMGRTVRRPRTSSGGMDYPGFGSAFGGDVGGSSYGGSSGGSCDSGGSSSGGGGCD